MQENKTKPAPFRSSTGVLE